MKEYPAEDGDDDVFELTDWLDGLPPVDDPSSFVYKVLESTLGIHYVVVARSHLEIAESNDHIKTD